MSTPPPAELVLCRRCGTIPPGRPGRWPTCDRCRLTIRIAQVLDDGTGRINPSLEPLAAALLAGPRLDTARMWLYKPYAAELLSALATGRIPLTHDELNRWPHHVAAQHLRHRLIACGVLPTVDRHLADTEVWLHRRLAQLADHPHERLLRQFALWHQLPKLRATAANRPLRSTAKPYATQQFTQAQGFLTWLHDQGIDPAALTQANLDTWYATHRVHQRQRVRGFLTWAIEQGHLPRHLTPHGSCSSLARPLPSSVASLCYAATSPTTPRRYRPGSPPACYCSTPSHSPASTDSPPRTSPTTTANS
ncbi:hypothetical protein AB0K27_20840 [Micromonospora echinospora]|uniref:hypothetical protein n=1 Tax=Micromonospora echinospora TaxID=1877 RepID=UPI00343C7205